ncbi:MAG: nucleotidyl transferase AbiEii/AbiGii toxin family protein [Prevotellaceae bacterium]|nr:nucleotidyl transferase AbiEii/AbiGii toxin family protein [Prevotellaceae bacterium]
MTLHENAQLFTDTILAAAEHFAISPVYIEKDYWITRVLQRMAQNPNAEKVVFKGGTSLSKAYRLTNRFSEDIDIAAIDANSFSGNQLKMLIKQLAKDITAGLEEIVLNSITSKGSRFYKAVYQYLTIIGQSTRTAIKTGQLLVEINTYANPYPYQKQTVTSFISDFYEQTNNTPLIEQYNLQPFTLNVLDKRRTMIEKLVSLFRFSFAENLIVELSAKIRHFYDLYYLANDSECATYIQSIDFQKDLSELFAHDQQEFNTPEGWQTKKIADSPLIKGFPAIWERLRSVYKNELTPLAFVEIPEEKEVETSFYKIIKNINR